MNMLALKRVRLCAILLVALSLVVISTGSARAEGEEEDKPTASVSTDILSQYIWRGMAYSQGSAVIQPSLTASYKGLSLNIWGNFDTDAKFQNNRAQGAKWTETDVTLSYTREIYGALSGTVGGIYYGYSLNSVMNASVDDSVEVYAGLSYAFPWFTVGVTGYREVSHYPGWFLQFDLSRNFKLPCWDMSLDLGTSFYYLNSSDSTAYPADFDNKGNPIDNGSAFAGMLSGQLATALNVPIGKYITVSPRVGYAFPLSGSATNLIRYISWDGIQNHVFGGLRLTAAF
jgi:uncharacterized protein (TIGR02001 family)